MSAQIAGRRSSRTESSTVASSFDKGYFEMVISQLDYGFAGATMQEKEAMETLLCNHCDMFVEKFVF